MNYNFIGGVRKFLHPIINDCTMLHLNYGGHINFNFISGVRTFLHPIINDFTMHLLYYASP